MAIYFGSHTGDDKLDDYEEGNWTPTLVGLTNSPTYHGRTGKFVRTGGLVNLGGYVQMGSPTLPDFTTEGTSAFISGVPYAGTNGVGHQGSMGVCIWQSLKWSGAPYNNYGGTVQLNCHVENGQTRVSFSVQPTNSSLYRGQLQNHAWDNEGFILSFQLFYRCY